MAWQITIQSILFYFSTIQSSFKLVSNALKRIVLVTSMYLKTYDSLTVYLSCVFTKASVPNHFFWLWNCSAEQQARLMLFPSFAKDFCGLITQPQKLTFQLLFCHKSRQLDVQSHKEPNFSLPLLVLGNKSTFCKESFKFFLSLRRAGLATPEPRARTEIKRQGKSNIAFQQQPIVRSQYRRLRGQSNCCTYFLLR